MPSEDLFTPTKVFIKPKDQPEAEWQELGVLDGSTTLICDNSEKEPPFVFHCDIPALNFSFTLKRWSHKQNIWFGQHFGWLKKPRLTYKTIKRDCAKRNK